MSGLELSAFAASGPHTAFSWLECFEFAIAPPYNPAMFSEPLEPWELWVYPPLVAATMIWRSWPLQLRLAQLARLEVLVLTAVALFEIWHNRERRPGLARAVLIAISASVSFTLFNPGDPKLMYIITLALCLYIWLLQSLPGVFGWLLERLRR